MSRGRPAAAPYPGLTRKIRDPLYTTFQKIFTIIRIFLKSEAPKAPGLFTFVHRGGLDDELFHLYCEIVLENGKTILVEKNERINLMKTSRNEKHTEMQEIQNIPSGLTLNNLLEGGESYTFLRYESWGWFDWLV